MPSSAGGGAGVARRVLARPDDRVTPDQTIRVKYSCHGCDLAQQALEVPARPPKADLMVWMELTQILVSRDHRARRPECPSERCDLAIPSVAGRPVGSASVH